MVLPGFIHRHIINTLIGDLDYVSSVLVGWILGTLFEGACLEKEYATVGINVPTAVIVCSPINRNKNALQSAESRLTFRKKTCRYNVL
jgi:hypothetical protein